MKWEIAVALHYGTQQQNLRHYGKKLFSVLCINNSTFFQESGVGWPVTLYFRSNPPGQPSFFGERNNIALTFFQSIGL